MNRFEYRSLPPDDFLIHLDRETNTISLVPPGSTLDPEIPVITDRRIGIDLVLRLFIRGGTSPETKTELLRRHQEVLARSRLPLTRPQYS